MEFDTIVEPLARHSMNRPKQWGAQRRRHDSRLGALGRRRRAKLKCFIDGDYAFDVRLTATRGRYRNAFPDIERASTSGFSVPFRYSTLSAGQHTVSVVVTDEFGAQVERSSTFEVVRFDMAYINKANTPNLDWSYVLEVFQITLRYAVLK